MAASEEGSLRRVQPGLRQRDQVRTLHAWGTLREHPHVTTTQFQMGIHVPNKGGLEGGQANRGSKKPKGMGLTIFYIEITQTNFIILYFFI